MNKKAILRAHNSGQQDASDGRGERNLWSSPTDSWAQTNAEQRAYLMGYWHAIGQQDRTNNTSRTIWSGSTESDEHYSARHSAYHKGLDGEEIEHDDSDYEPGVTGPASGDVDCGNDRENVEENTARSRRSDRLYRGGDDNRPSEPGGERSRSPAPSPTRSSVETDSFSDDYVRSDPTPMSLGDKIVVWIGRGIGVILLVFFILVLYGIVWPILKAVVCIILEVFFSTRCAPL